MKTTFHHVVRSWIDTNPPSKLALRMVVEEHLDFIIKAKQDIEEACIREHELRLYEESLSNQFDDVPF